MDQNSAQTFLSLKEVAEKCGITVQTAIRRGMPAADAHIGRVSGWSETTIEKWQADWSQRRPGRYPKS